MNSETEKPSAPLRHTLAEIALTTARLVFAWLLILCLMAWAELRWHGGFREIYTQVEDNPNLMFAAAVPVLLGQLVTALISASGQAWMNRYQLLTQAIVGGVLMLVIGTLVFIMVVVVRH
ncbi:MAG TPA: hypothetical protein VJ748_09505 [Vitreimonas sp.]|jgi:ATP/ADP translocase|nr:hypothetical protein [Vitreimonas sp.]